MRHSHYSIIKSTPSQILESGNLLVIRYSGENLFLKEEVCPLSSCALKSLLLLFIFFSFCVYMFSIARECLCGLVCVCASASRCLSMEELYRNRSGFFFFFFFNTCNHTMINCEDLHISNLKKNTVFRPKISQAK